MRPTRAHELLTLAQIATRDAHVTEISAWTRLMATYDAAVCVVAVLANSEIPPSIERDNVLEKLLGAVRFDGDTMRDLQTLIRCYRVELRGEVIVTHAEIDRVLQCVERLWNEATSQLRSRASIQITGIRT